MIDIQLKPETEAWLKSAVSEQGQTTEEYAVTLIENHLATIRANVPDDYLLPAAQLPTISHKACAPSSTSPA